MTTTTAGSVYVFDLGGVCCSFNHERRLDALACVSRLPRAEVGHRLWETGFVEECNRGRFTTQEAYAWASAALRLKIEYPAFRRIWSSAFTPVPSVLGLVDAVRARHRTVMLTDNGPFLRDHLGMLFPEVSQRFDEMLFSCDLGAIKPEPKLFMAATSRLGVAPDQITFIDDVPEFVAAAKGFGWHGLTFTGHEQLTDQLTAASRRTAYKERDAQDEDTGNSRVGR